LFSAGFIRSASDVVGPWLIVDQSSVLVQFWVIVSTLSGPTSNLFT